MAPDYYGQYRLNPKPMFFHTLRGSLWLEFGQKGLPPMDSQRSNWQKQGLPLPLSPRLAGRVSQHPLSKGLMLFGGSSRGEGFLNDIWLLDQGGWQKREQPRIAPQGRFLMGMSYDQERQVVVLFGGRGREGLLGDTWTFDGNVWAEQHPSASPSPRADVSMAYDAMHKQTLLFGGFSATARDPVYLGDTWVWNGSCWVEQSPAKSPAPRFGSCIAYDAARQNIVLFGGLGVSNTAFNDTWVWDGATWIEKQPARRPSPRAYASMVYDEASQQVLLFGGDAGKGPVNETWVWDGEDWKEMQPETRPPMQAGVYPALGYDPVLQSVVLVASLSDKETITDKTEPSTWSEVWLWH